jgi:hypothetical protein
MATVLEACTTEEHCSFVHFLWAEGLNAKDIHKQMFPAYGGKLSCKAVHSWVADVLLMMKRLKWGGAVMAETTVGRLGF